MIPILALLLSGCTLHVYLAPNVYQGQAQKQATEADAIVEALQE